jgi:predicted XRE-type DNA-binding protein
MIEEWKDIPGKEGRYQVSNLGNVRSLTHTAPHGRYPGKTRVMKGRVLKQSIASTGYPVVAYRSDGNHHKLEVHALVAAAFLVRPTATGWHVHHRDGDKTNNRIENLVYKTKSAHMSEHNRGEGHRSVKLNEAQVRNIRSLLQLKYVTQKQIAEIYGVAQAHISTIKLRKSWKHI